MKISLIMGTLNREELAVRAIKSVLSQTYTDWEIIVVDQSKESYTSSILVENEKVIHIKCDKKGLSRARNTGIKMARGEIIGLMDDDAVYCNNALSKVNSIFESEPGLMMLAGRIIDFNTEPNNYGVKKYISFSNFMNGICVSPSIFIRKKFFENEEFDENLGVGCYLGSAEESDVVARILEKNYKAQYDDSVIVYHHTKESKQDLDITKHASYCRGFGAFCAKHFIKYKNRRIMTLYLMRMFRTRVGLILARIKRDKRSVEIYETSLASRKEGFALYKEILEQI